MARIIVVDDDPLAGELTLTLLQDAGHEVTLIGDSTAALDAINSRLPDLVILDILMPGIDGLTLCHRIKHAPATQAVRVVMVSGKSFAADRKRATDYGADAFIEKPYDVDGFSQKIAGLLGAAPAAAPQAAPAAAPLDKFRLTVWGCRSLSAVQGAPPSRYGRRTSCVALEKDELLLVLDAGSGLVPLGRSLVESGRWREPWLLITHFHQDHFEGLGRFAPAYADGYKLNIGGANDPDQSLQERVQRAFEIAPPELGSVQAELELYEMMEQTYEIAPGLQVSSFFANHPGTTLGFIVESEGRKVVYCPDSEIYGEQGTAMQDYDERLVRLAGGADIFIHDARYLDPDYQLRKNNGHSSWLNTVELAARAEVKRLVLFHHDDAYGDDVLDRIETEARAHVAGKGYALEATMAREGLTLAC
ncbi:MAG: response regulator [Elusimicrobia bacterium]|nr:response regulator [Elusimicrobiota bacterium]